MLLRLVHCPSTARARAGTALGPRFDVSTPGLEDTLQPPVTAPRSPYCEFVLCRGLCSPTVDAGTFDFTVHAAFAFAATIAFTFGSTFAFDERNVATPAAPTAAAASAAAAAQTTVNAGVRKNAALTASASSTGSTASGSVHWRIRW